MPIKHQPKPKNHDGFYARIDNDLLRDSRLSFRARGIAAYLLSMSPEWTFSGERLAQVTNEGRDACKKALAELRKYGYVTTQVVMGEDGKRRTINTFHEVPIQPTTDFQASVDQSSVPETDSQATVFQATVDQSSVHQATVNQPTVFQATKEQLVSTTEKNNVEVQPASTTDEELHVLSDLDDVQFINSIGETEDSSAQRESLKTLPSDDVVIVPVKKKPGGLALLRERQSKLGISAGSR